MFLSVSCGSTSQSLVSFAQAVPWVITIFGWIWVKSDNDRRQSRKELRERLDIIQDLVTEIEDLAFHYFTNAQGSDSDAEANVIRSKLKKLGHQVAVVKKVHGDAFNAESLLIDFRKSVTGGEFDSHSRMAVRETDPVLLDIQDSGWELVSKLDSAFDQPKPTWRSRIIAWFKSLACKYKSGSTNTTQN